MESHFNIEIANTSFELISMNVKRPQLFQVYVIYQGQKRRFHMKEDGNGNFVFAMPDDCPADILQHEAELSARIWQFCTN